MSLSHPEAIVDEMVDLVVDKIDVGTTNANGKVELRTATDTLIGTLQLSNPAFAAASGRDAVANAITSSTAIAAGSIKKAIFYDRDDNEVFRGTVTELGGGGDLEADGLTLTVAVGESLGIPSFTYRGMA